MNVVQSNRILSGMRATGEMHLGHYHGVIKHWLKLQYEYECYFMVADWHALTTHYEDSSRIMQHTRDMIVTWLACGVNPSSAKIFIQSKIPEIAELHLLLSMITPLSWLERIPSYKEQQEKLKERDLSTYGFLGYPLLQAADVLVFRAFRVPVGEDQVPHIEMAREIARRFNYIYGREQDFEQQAEAAIVKLGPKNATLYRQLRRAYQERGQEESLETAQALLETQQNIPLGDRERLHGYLEGVRRFILPEPEPLLRSLSKMLGLDGRKMSKSYQNTVPLNSDQATIAKKIKGMQTDPARATRRDPGEPEKCPVWQLHQAYTDQKTQDWVCAGCRSAGIGCVDCKQPLIEAMQAELKPISEKFKELSEKRIWVDRVIAEGCDMAREEARETLSIVREEMGLED